MNHMHHHEWPEHRDIPRRSVEAPTRRRIDDYRGRFAPEGRVKEESVRTALEEMLDRLEGAVQSFNGDVTLIVTLKLPDDMAGRLHRELGIIGSREDLAGALERNGLVGRRPRERSSETERYRSAYEGLQRFNPDLARRFDRTFQRMQGGMDGLDTENVPTREEMMQRQFQSRYGSLLGPGIFE